MGIRQELGQLSWAAKRYRSPRQLATQARVNRRLSVPRLPVGTRRPGEVWGVTVVRDELDVLPLVIDHLFAQGVDHVIVADNLSADGTREYLLERAGRDHRVHAVLDSEPGHFQSEKMTAMAHLAWRAGADWVVPFDGDEFWFAEGQTVADKLRSLPEAGIVHAHFHHMVPTVAAPPDLVNAEFVLDARASFPGKVAVRSHPLAVVLPGNHSAMRVGAQVGELFIAHAIYRGPVQVARKVRQGTQAAKLTGEDLSWFSPHWAEAAGLDDAAIEDVWNTISAGLPEPRLKFAAAGPMVRVRPLRWSTWDPDHEVPREGRA